MINQHSIDFDMKLTGILVEIFLTHSIFTNPLFNLTLHFLAFDLIEISIPAEIVEKQLTLNLVPFFVLNVNGVGRDSNTVLNIFSEQVNWSFE